MPRRFWLLAAMGVAVSLVAGCGVSFTTGHATRSGWVRIVTPHFAIDTDVFEPRALSMAHDLEDSRAALLASVWPGAKDPGGRTRVMLFARQRDLGRYAGRNNQGVVFTRSGFERLLALTPGSTGDVPTVAAHELVHDLTRWFWPVQPLWFSEGLAVYFEAIELDRTSGHVLMGDVSRARLEWLRSAKNMPSTAQLFAMREADAIDPRDTASFYLGSLALVHYLRSEEPEAFARFQSALMRLVPWRRAWEQAFPRLTTAELDRRLEAYVNSGRFKPWRTRFAPPVFTPDVRALSLAEVHGARALLASTSGQAVSGAEVTAALELDPSELDALTVRFHTLGARA